MKKLFAVLVMVHCFTWVITAQTDLRELVRKQLDLYSKLENAHEGFFQAIQGEQINYHSSREDCPSALLTRATNGTMISSWVTPEIRLAEGQAQFCLFLITGMSQQGYKLEDENPCFTLLVNEEPWFEFCNALGESWTISSEKGGQMSFDGLVKDQHNDVFGYTRICLPAKVLSDAGNIRLAIRGEASGSQHWFMVFTCSDALDWFSKKALGDDWFSLDFSQGKSGIEVDFRTQKKWTGHPFRIHFNHNKDFVFSPKPLPGGDIGYNGVIKGVNLSDSLSLTLESGHQRIAGPVMLNNPMTRTDIKTDRLVYHEFHEDKNGTWHLEVQHFSSSAAGLLEMISSSHLSRGRMHLFVSSHQDIAWMDSPEACIEDRDELLITPALEKLRETRNYAIDMEDILMLREYLERHPDRKQEIHDLGIQGRLTWGASYIQPYEEMYSGESLVRQFYLGKRWFEKEFPGCQSNIYWNVDVPGRTLQMPQILAKCDVPYMIISRHEPGLFNWKAPDGSRVLTFSPGHYYNSYIHLKKGFFETLGHFADLTKQWNSLYNEKTVSPVMPVLSAADMALPDSYFSYIDLWNSMSNQPYKLPDLFHSTAERFFKELDMDNISIPEISGERPSVWLYIHGPSHFQALRSGRSAGRILPAAEKLALFATMVEQNTDLYPAEHLTSAWEMAIYPDHGWGGNQGEITDSIFLEKFRGAEVLAGNVLQNSIDLIAERVRPVHEGQAVVVFNAMDWERTDPAQIMLNDLQDNWIRHPEIIDDDGNLMVWEYATAPVYHDSGYLKSASLVFIAERVPGNGYKTFLLRPGESKKLARTGFSLPGRVFENSYYRIEFGDGGMKALFDKELDCEIWNPDLFSGGEPFTMHSEGNGAGEFADIQQPDMRGFDRLSAHKVNWQVVSDSDLSIKICGEAKWEHNLIRITWVIFHTIKRIDITAELIDWDGTAFREFRLAFPVDLDHPSIHYEVPFGVLEVGKDELQHAAGERYTTPCPEIHPRGIGDWISASDGIKGVTLSSDVAVWDYKNPTDLATNSTMLQPILLASRQSCHGLGPLYHQTGTHLMSFSLFTHKPGWQNGYREALQSKHPLLVSMSENSPDAFLPMQFSFVGLQAEGVRLSALKKAEEGDDWILRIYNLESLSKEVEVALPFDIEAAFMTNMLETPVGQVSFFGNRLFLNLGGHAIETVRIKRIELTH